MTDLNKEGKVNLSFEQDNGAVWVFAGDSQFGTEISHLMMMHVDEYNEDELRVICHHAACEIDRLRAELEKAKAQAVLDTQQKLTDTYYLEGSDYVVDCPFEYDIEIDKGEVLELQKWQRTESTKVYFANIYKDEDNFEILQFASKAEAENAVAENLKFLEASESGAEG
ncbi:TPA: hypothetical protein NU789_001739 [Acinetobacter baumannii]|uniref:hypothetical protein n=2 Tax=Acinetobacter baumannii TaxID=470 RepID=UPI000B542B45|nr:hypothetical protein [Acinetobacter baumannii]OWX15402.1 hypothetical protein A7A33_00995 [Acinetobacter baumannii]PZL91251.1 hypothetical protein DOL91_10160 [Acinetobacter baumannii]TLT27763.1 hypothetical protein FD872_05060 [Acinetobacter baumannii]TLT74475.1 hypothetical protein FD891_07360 [Acinetobacter baumannii]TLT83253.1 hypothetical protein FD881_06420 [Acinetobacter baumannii]